MTIKDICALLGIEELPERYGPGLERFDREWPRIREEPLLELDKLAPLAEEGFLDAACFDDVNICLQKLKAEEPLAYTLQFLYHMLCVYGNSWDNDLYLTPAPPCLEEYRYTFALILFLRTLYKGVTDDRRRGIPEDKIDQMKGVFGGATGNCRAPWGIRDDFHWNMSCVMGAMFFVGTFRYELMEMPPYYRMYRRRSDGKLLALYCGEARVDKAGQFTHLDELTAFRTEASQGDWDGYMIRPDGVLLNQQVTLSPEKWEPVYCSGDMALSYHIPGNIPYHVDMMKETFQEAVAFYQKYFPDIELKGLQCYSWLYSPQLRFMLSEESGINRLNSHLYLCPVPSGPDGFYSFVFHTDTAHFDPDTADVDTSLKRGFIEFVRKGGRAHNGFMYLPLAYVDRLGSDCQELYAWDLFE